MSIRPEDAERWQGNQRQDGLAIVEGVDGWVIMPKAEGLPLDKCPCCDKVFARNDVGLRAAKLVADMAFPVGRAA
jgi:hypothetical protein